MPLRYWYRAATGRFEKELHLVRRIVPRGHVSIDIGANNGAYTYLLHGFCRQVEAFEPVPVCAERLRAFRAPNVRVHQVALSSSAGTRKLFIPRTTDVVHTALASLRQPSGWHDTVEVAVRRLDDYRFDDVVFIKIDTEGHELEVIRGSVDTIQRCRPLLLVEIEQRHLTFPMEDVFEGILRYGYKGFFMKDGHLRPLESFSAETDQEPYLTNVQSPRYVNNFLFVHAGSRLRGKVPY